MGGMRLVTLTLTLSLKGRGDEGADEGRTAVCARGYNGARAGRPTMRKGCGALGQHALPTTAARRQPRSRSRGQASCRSP